MKITDEVELEYYRLKRAYSGAIGLAEGEAGYVVSPTDVGTGRPEEERAPLSEIIEALNEKFGTHFTDEDRLFWEQVKERAVKDERIRQTGRANPYDKFALGIRKLIEQMMLDRMADNDAIVTRYLSDAEFQDTAFPVLARAIFEAVGEETPTPGADAVDTNESPRQG